MRVNAHLTRTPIVERRHDVRHTRLSNLTKRDRILRTIPPPASLHILIIDTIPFLPSPPFGLWHSPIQTFNRSPIQTFNHSPIQTFNRSLYSAPDISTQASIVTVQPLGTAFHKRKECATSPSRDATSQVQCHDVPRPRHSRSDRRYRHASAPRVCGHASSRMSWKA